MTGYRLLSEVNGCYDLIYRTPCQRLVVNTDPGKNKVEKMSWLGRGEGGDRKGGEGQGILSDFIRSQTYA